MELCRGKIGGGGDVLVEEVVGILPCAWVVVALGDSKADRGFDEIAALQLEVGCGGGEECGAYAAGDRDHCGGVGGDLFDGGEIEVEREGGGGVFTGRGGVVPLVWIVVCASFCEAARRELTDASDAGCHGAAQAVGVGKERSLRGRRGLDLGRPEACGDP